MHRHIAIGETSSFRYIGIEPPLTATQANNILDNVTSPNWMYWGLHRSREDGLNPNHSPYTEFHADVGDALDILGGETVDQGTMELALQMARILKTHGDTVTVEDEILSISYDIPLFGAEADERRELLAEIGARVRAAAEPKVETEDTLLLDRDGEPVIGIGRLDQITGVEAAEEFFISRAARIKFFRDRALRKHRSNRFN